MVSNGNISSSDSSLESLLGTWKAENVFNDGKNLYRFEYILHLDPDNEGSLKQCYLGAEITSCFTWHTSNNHVLVIKYLYEDQDDEEVSFKYLMKENNLYLKYGGLLLNFTRTNLKD